MENFFTKRTLFLLQYVWELLQFLFFFLSFCIVIHTSSICIQQSTNPKMEISLIRAKKTKQIPNTIINQSTYALPRNKNPSNSLSIATWTLSNAHKIRNSHKAFKFLNDFSNEAVNEVLRGERERERLCSLSPSYISWINGRWDESDGYFDDRNW